MKAYENFRRGKFNNLSHTELVGFKNQIKGIDQKIKVMFYLFDSKRYLSQEIVKGSQERCFPSKKINATRK
jgi:hypothetical protein